MRQSFIEVSNELQRLHSDNADVESMWLFFHEQYTNIIKTNIPTKMLKQKVNHPWIKPDVKKLLKKRDSKFRKLKKTGSEKLKEEIRVLKREIQRKNRRAYWDHVNTLFVKKENDAPQQ